MARPSPVEADQILALGAIEGPGQRTYLAVWGGFAAREILGSRSTFALGQFGGHATGTLRAGDLLAFAHAQQEGAELPRSPAPLAREWRIGVLYGPHGALDFFAPEDIAPLFDSAYEVHFNSSRTGVRLISPAPRWARVNGGEAGLHPSNIHDNAYAVGAIVLPATCRSSSGRTGRVWGASSAPR